MANKASILLPSPLEVQNTWKYEKSTSRNIPLRWYSLKILMRAEVAVCGNFQKDFRLPDWSSVSGFPFLWKTVLFVMLVCVMLISDSPIVVMSLPFFFLSRQALHVHFQETPALSCFRGNNPHGCKPHVHLQCTSAWFVASHHLTLLDFIMTFCKL